MKRPLKGRIRGVWPLMLTMAGVLCLTILTPLTTAHPQTDVVPTDPYWEVCFSPRGGCAALIVKTITAAHSSVLVQAYSFTSAPIAKALLNAAQRGLTVDVILDRSQRSERYSIADFLLNAKIPVAIDAAHPIAHNKVIVVDAALVITGSFNFTKSADEQNAENVLIIRDPVLAVRYTQNWRDHARHSSTYVR